MYNGIGLQTPRGSGTNGYVQRNVATVRKTKDSVNYRTEEEIAKLDSASNKQPNQEILDHERKRKIEVKCAELEDSLEEQGLPNEEIAARVAAFRAKLAEVGSDKDVPRDDFGRVAVRETHAVASAQQEKNARLREAFGISPSFVEGSSLAPERRARDLAARYPLVRTPSAEREHERAHSAKKKKKRSSSPDAKRLKKKKSKKNKKEKQESGKKKKKLSKSPNSDSCSSSEGAAESDSSSDDERNRKKKKKKSSSRRRASSEPSSRESSPVKHDIEKPREHSETKSYYYHDRRADTVRSSRPDYSRSRKRDDRSTSREHDISPEYIRKAHMNKVDHRRDASRDDYDKPKTKSFRRERRSSPEFEEEPSPKKTSKKYSKQYRRDSASPPPEKRRRKSSSLELEDRGDRYKNRRESDRNTEISRKYRESFREEKRDHRRSESPSYWNKRQESYGNREKDKNYKRNKSEHDLYEEEPPKRRDRETDVVKPRKRKSSTRNQRDLSPEYEERSPVAETNRNKESRKGIDKTYKNSKSARKSSESESELESPPKRISEKVLKNLKYQKERSESLRRERRRSYSQEYKSKDFSLPRSKIEKYIASRTFEHSRSRRKSSSPEVNPGRSKSRSPIPRKGSRQGKQESVPPKQKRSEMRMSPNDRHYQKEEESQKRKPISLSPSPSDSECYRNMKRISPNDINSELRNYTEKEYRKRKPISQPSPSGPECYRNTKLSPNDRNSERRYHKEKEFQKLKSPPSQRRSRSSSSLSYSPARRSPERYRDIIDRLPEKDKRKYIKSPSNLKPKKKTKEGENYKPKTVCIQSSSSEIGSDSEFLKGLEERARQDEFELRKLKQKLTQMAKVSMELKRNEEANVPSTSQAAHGDPNPKESDKAKKLSPIKEHKEPSPKPNDKKSPVKAESPKKNRSPIRVDSSPEARKRDRSGSRRSWSQSRGKSSRGKSRSRSRDKARSRSRDKSRSRSRDKSRSRSRDKYRLRSNDKTRSRSRDKSRSRSRDKSRLRSNDKSRSRSRNKSRSRSRDKSRSRSRDKSRSRSRDKSRSRSRDKSRSRSRDKSRSRSRGKASRSRSRGKSSRSRSRSHGKSSRSRSRGKSSRSRSRSRSSRSRSRSYSSSRGSRSSRSSSYSSRSSSRSSSSSSRSTRTMTGVYDDYCRSTQTRTRARSRSRSLSIPRRAGSPSFLDRRRITSAPVIGINKGPKKSKRKRRRRK